MRAAAAALLLLLLSSVASLAQPVNVIGAVTPGHCVSFFSTTQIQDSGGVCGGAGGGISGPGISVVGDVATWSNTTGSAIADTGISFPGGFSFAGTLTGATAVTFPISGTLATTATFAAPPAIGNTTPAAGAFTTLSASGNLTTNVTGSTQCLQVNASGVVSGTGSACGAGGGTTPGGSPSQLQYNNSGAFGGIAGATTNGTVVTFGNSDLALRGSSSGATTFASANSGVGNFTLTLPATTDTLAVLGTPQNFTAPQTFSIAQTIVSATAAVWRNLYGAGATTTITGNTGSPITALYAAEIAQPTLTDASAVTVTNAATLFIAGAPIAAGSVTITNPWAIRVGAGNVSFPGAANALGTITSGTWNGGVIGLNFGGTNNALTASAGGIVWSDASKLNILAGTSTAGLCLLSGNLVTPAWTACPGGAPGGANTNVQFNNSGAFGGDAGFTYAGNGQVTHALGTITTNNKALNITGTWNAAGTTFDAPLFMNIVNTASAAASSLLDLQVGGTSLLILQPNTNAIMSLGDGVTASGFRVFNTADTLSGPTNYERGVFDWSQVANTLLIGTQKGGTGTARALTLLGTQLDFINVAVTGSLTTPLTRMPAGGGINLAGGFIKWQPGQFADGTSTVSVGPSGGSGGTNGVLAIGNGTSTDTSGFFNYGGQTRVTSDFSVTSSTALVNVTGLTVNLVAGRNYQFEAELYVTDAAAGGVQAAIAGTATATAIQYVGYAIADNAIKGKTNATALATAVASTTTTETSGIIVRISGVITVNAAGTMTVQMAQNTSNATATIAKRGSWFLVQDVQ